MARMTLFNSPLLLGFDEIERTLDRASKMSSEGYPPYNIEQISEHHIRITLAVAGFAEEDLSITREGDQLVVAGRQIEQEPEQRLFLHRGIASRQFHRRFVLAEGIEIEGASLNNGLLDIDLNRPRLEPKVQTITINKGKKRKPRMVAIEDA